MAASILPAGFDDLVSHAVRAFWESRRSGSEAQGGSRGAVLSGNNLDGFLELVIAVARHCGMAEDCLSLSGRTKLTIPGFFRPTKQWDVVVVHDNRLVAVLELKSQVGSIGNNFNNRTEEVLGSGIDLATAAQKGVFHPSRHVAGAEASLGDDPRPPFAGYLMLLEDSEATRQPKDCSSPHYRVLREFEQSSYSDRYRILCEKLIEQRLYDAASLVLSPMPDPGEESEWACLSEATHVRTLFAELAATLLAAMA